MRATCPKGHPVYLVNLVTQHEAFEWNENGEPEPTVTVDYGSYEGDDFEPYITCPTCCRHWPLDDFPRDESMRVQTAKTYEETRASRVERGGVFACPDCGGQKVEADVPRASQVRYYNDDGEVVDADTDYGDLVVNERCAECERPFSEAAWKGKKGT